MSQWHDHYNPKTWTPGSGEPPNPSKGHDKEYRNPLWLKSPLYKAGWRCYRDDLVEYRVIKQKLTEVVVGHCVFFGKWDTAQKKYVEKYWVRELGDDEIDALFYKSEEEALKYLRRLAQEYKDRTIFGQVTRIVRENKALIAGVLLFAGAIVWGKIEWTPISDIN